jgi:hypothetical protein
MVRGTPSSLDIPPPNPPALVGVVLRGLLAFRLSILSDFDSCERGVGQLESISSATMAATTAIVDCRQRGI